jgi:hypothetical protein
MEEKTGNRVIGGILLALPIAAAFLLLNRPSAWFLTGVVILVVLVRILEKKT